MDRHGPSEFQGNLSPRRVRREVRTAESRCDGFDLDDRSIGEANDRDHGEHLDEACVVSVPVGSRPILLLLLLHRQWRRDVRNEFLDDSLHSVVQPRTLGDQKEGRTVREGKRRAKARNAKEGEITHAIRIGRRLLRIEQRRDSSDRVGEMLLKPRSTSISLECVEGIQKEKRRKTHDQVTVVGVELDRRLFFAIGGTNDLTTVDPVVLRNRRRETRGKQSAKEDEREGRRARPTLTTITRAPTFSSKVSRRGVVLQRDRRRSQLSLIRDTEEERGLLNQSSQRVRHGLEFRIPALRQLRLSSGGLVHTIVRVSFNVSQSLESSRVLLVDSLVPRTSEEARERKGNEGELDQTCSNQKRDDLQEGRFDAIGVLRVARDLLVFLGFGHHLLDELDVSTGVLSKSHPVEHARESGILLSMSVFEEMAFAGGEGLDPGVRGESEVLVSVLR